MKHLATYLLCLINFALIHGFGHNQALFNPLTRSKIGEVRFESSSFSAQLYGSLEESILKKALAPLPIRKLTAPRRIASSDDVPTSPDHAKVARYLVHTLDWCAIATISTRDPIKNLPFANVFSFSDGIESSGIPYLYLTELEMSVKDILVNPNISMTLSMAQTAYCTQKGLDIQDPRCSHIILNGVIKTLDVGSKEEAFARTALWTRHPEMPMWDGNTQGHNWFFAKLEISNVIVLDFFGGAHYITVDEYFAAKL